MRVFFDFIDGARTTHDVDGHECENVEAIRTELARVLPEVLLSDARDGAEREVACSVRDEGGVTLFRGSITLRLQEMTNR